ncbi:MAG: DRTGG domain-containing protein [Desulfatiglandales bacterium]
MAQKGIEKGDAGLTLREVAEELKARIYCGEEHLSNRCSKVAAADLMSDLLRIPVDHVVLLTGLNSVQAVRTCVLINMRAMILVRGKEPSQDVIEEARKYGLPLMSTKFSLFTSCGRLYARGLSGLP